MGEGRKGEWSVQWRVKLNYSSRSNPWCFQYQSHEIGWEECLQNDLFYVEWNAKPELYQSNPWSDWRPHRIRCAAADVLTTFS